MDHTRLLIERVVVAIGAKIFPNEISREDPVLNIPNGFRLRNRKK
jgi:hypothetical protein